MSILSSTSLEPTPYRCHDILQEIWTHRILPRELAQAILLNGTPSSCRPWPHFGSAVVPLGWQVRPLEIAILHVPLGAWVSEPISLLSNGQDTMASGNFDCSYTICRSGNPRSKKKRCGNPESHHAGSRSKACQPGRLPARFVDVDKANSTLPEKVCKAIMISCSFPTAITFEKSGLTQILLRNSGRSTLFNGCCHQRSTFDAVS
ncbi:uncharacterized protein HMPREF1120_06090 [Exophiala dermatitidis NIH/UT8656]|uniref:Uncharacterized protein n=1 Tax=Exophiala dermatitidis (strain ATCC 34100 / CBS 525.76 / NIH/UT8656) TaxID=858893 RepID=H6C357_EXODN|nr:uncharacterized protein HMPREF1120_06090 [Exophiala dermatitidis NIH/UT8656]EHY58072.1 hypothetical protein HMPREF1120_06090 [Exophiala dermatitidis NIH/UT8656]